VYKSMNSREAKIKKIKDQEILLYPIFWIMD
jgi:hypothetical protein